MQYQQLGKTGVFVSRLCFGAMTFGGRDHPLFKYIGGQTQREADHLVRTALDAGINFFDTADIYSSGESEIMLGKALGSRRKDVVLATKLTGRVGAGPNQVGQSRIHIMDSVENSLKRLGTDHIDLYQIHLFDPLTRFDESLRTFDDLIHHGKIRYIGCSNLAAWQVMKALGVSKHHGWQKFVSVQAYYSVVGRDIEREIVPLVESEKLALLTWSPLAGGLLSGKFSRDSQPKEEARRTHFDFPPVKLEFAYTVIDVLRKVAKRHNTSVAKVALAWQLHKPFITSIIIGAKNIAQLQDNLGATDLVLTIEDLIEIDAVSMLCTEYPEWMHRNIRERLPGQTQDWSSTIKKP